jgi:uncharacterized protein YyaL (SSP411 family)
MVKKGEKHLATLFSEYFHHPLAYTFLLTALDWALGPSNELVISSPTEGPSDDELLDAFHKGFFPRTVVHHCTPDNQELKGIAPIVLGKSPLNGLPTAYVCSEKGCQAPTTDLKEMLSLLKQKRFD